MTAMMNLDERFETDLRAAMAVEPAGDRLRRRILERATSRTRQDSTRQDSTRWASTRWASNGPSRWLAAFDPRNWRLPVLVELGALAAAASLAIGVFAGASGYVFGTAVTTASADTTVDLVALAYDDTGSPGDPL